MAVRWAETVPAALRSSPLVDLRDTGTAAVLVIDVDDRVAAGDDTAARILGSDDVLGSDRAALGLQFLAADGRPLAPDDDPVARVRATGLAQDVRLLGLDRDGASPSFAWLLVSASPLRSDDGSLLAVALTCRDVTDADAGRRATAGLARAARAADRAAADDQARFRALAEDAADAVLEADVAGRCTWVTPSVERLLGWTPDELLGTSVLPLLHPDDRERMHEQRRADLAGGGSAGRRLEVRYAVRDGGWRWVSATSRPLRDAAGRVTGTLTALHDVQSEVEDRAQQRYVAGRDGLTGLLDREAAVHELGRALRGVQASTALVGVLMLDLDRFAEVNDREGIEAGDRLLVEVGTRLRGALRGTDSVARLGADEFLVVLHRVREEGNAVARALALRDVVARPGADGRSVTVSVGVVTDDGSGDTSTLLRAAEEALHRAKLAGRDAVSL